MRRWVRFDVDGNEQFGMLDGERILEYEGDMFGESSATDRRHELDAVTLLAPCRPGKIVAMWNNSYALAEKQRNAIPAAPLYFIKPSSCIVGPEVAVEKPATYDGRVFYEGELGIVIGKRCRSVPVDEAADYVFGYTCVNDVSAMQLVNEHPAFEQWTRAKSFDTFGPLGPCIAEIDDPETLTVKTLVNGRERQNYPITDMIFSPLQLVSLISQDLTLEAGDVIACGTSLGSLPMKPGAEVEVVIDGVGSLRNQFVAGSP